MGPYGAPAPAPPEPPVAVPAEIVAEVVELQEATVAEEKVEEPSAATAKEVEVA